VVEVDGGSCCVCPLGLVVDSVGGACCEAPLTLAPAAGAEPDGVVIGTSRTACVGWTVA